MPHAIGLPVALADVPVSAVPQSPFADTSMLPDRPLSQAIRRLSLVGVHQLPHVIERSPRAGRHIPPSEHSHTDVDASSPSSAAAVSDDDAPTTAAASIVNRQAVPISHSTFTADIGLKPLQNVFGRCVNPFSSLAKDMQHIYSVTTDQRVSEDLSNYFNLFGQIIDTITGVEPRLAMARSLCRASERALEIVEGGVPEVGDITEMTETWRAVGVQKAQKQHAIKAKPEASVHAHARPGTNPKSQLPGIDINESADLVWFIRDMTSIVEQDPEDGVSVEGSRRPIRTDMPPRPENAGLKTVVTDPVHDDPQGGEGAQDGAPPCLTKTGVDLMRYQTSLNDLPFLTDRPLLRDAIVQSKADLMARYFSQGMDGAERSAAPIDRPIDVLAVKSTDKPIDEPIDEPTGGDDVGDRAALRQALSRQWATLVGWEQLSVRQKQQLAARIVEDVFRDHAEGRGVADGAAYCPWMLDLMSAHLQRRLRSSRHLMQISFIADGRGGSTHSALLYADDPAVFVHFGQVNAPRGDLSKINPMAHSVFVRFLFDYREHVAIIDPVGPRLVSDFTQQRGLLGAELMLEDVLRAANFDVGPNAAYRVVARIPTMKR